CTVFVFYYHLFYFKYLGKPINFTGHFLKWEIGLSRQGPKKKPRHRVASGCLNLLNAQLFDISFFLISDF
ncbi:MAG: hypothetical protein ACK55Z_27795, partial [bacterium]